MVTNGILNSSKEPITRWDCPDVDQETIKITVGERLRFPYASNVVTPNRMMKSAMSEQLATYDKNDMKKSGVPTRELINLYEKFADGGFGTIVTGCIMINGKDIEAPGNVIIDKELDSEERRNAFKEWTECATRSGSIIIAQLFHPGKYAADLPHKTDFNINKLTRKQIGELINDYAYAASYAQQCGFNGVEISCAYFFALGQLITSSANTRNDEFGGKLDNRAKILFKIIQAIRMKICKPSRFVIGLKLFCGNFEPDYNDDVFGEFVHNVEKTGFDYIAITGGHYNLIKDLKRSDDPKTCEYFYQKFVLTMRKHLTRTKLFMNGGFVTLLDMVAAIRDGWAAGVSLARPVAAEPGFIKSTEKIICWEVKGATKSLFDPLDYSVEQEFAGSQLWQHGYLLTVMDASNPDHIEQFKKDLHLHEKQKSVGDELVIGEVDTSTVAMSSDEHPEECKLTTKVDDTENELIEEETHHVVKKQLDYGAPGDLQENTVEDSIRKVVKRHENLADLGVDVIEETIEKVILTQSDFLEPSQRKSSPKPETQADDFSKHADGALDTVAEALDASFSDVKTALESAFEEDVKLVDEVVKDITEGLRKENEEANARSAIHKDEHHEEAFPTQQSESKDIIEVISGLSNGDKPIIAGIVEEAKDTNDTMKPVEHVAELENRENLFTENEKHPMTETESPFGGENYDIHGNVAEDVMRKEAYIISAEMTTSFMGEILAPEAELSPGKGDEQFTDAPETDRTDLTRDLTSNDFHEDIDNDIKDDSRLEATISKDIATNDHVQECPINKDCKDQNLEDEVTKSGWDGLSNEGDNSKVSSATYSTLFGSTLTGGNGGSVVYEEYYDKRSVPGQSTEETYHSEIYEIPSDESKNMKSAENLSSEKVDIHQVPPEFDAEESITDNNISTQKHGLTGFISSALPDSVQNLISSTRNKFDEMHEGDGKHQPEMQFTMKTEEMTGDDGLKYEIHTENYSVTNAGHRLSSDFGNGKAFLVDDSDRFKSDDDLTVGSADIHHSAETAITTKTNKDNKKSKKHRGGLFGDKKTKVLDEVLQVTVSLEEMADYHQCRSAE
ncbi:NADH-dependent flavin oxidoreductase [Dirofilaria immitis]|nr:NADH-dependent flavin oxidoreductase [Dirofilaria immitis]